MLARLLKIGDSLAAYALDKHAPELCAGQRPLLRRRGTAVARQRFPIARDRRFKVVGTGAARSAPQHFAEFSLGIRPSHRILLRLNEAEGSLRVGVRTLHDIGPRADDTISPSFRELVG